MNIIRKVKGYAIKTLLLYVAFVCVLLHRLCFFFSINYIVFVMKITAPLLSLVCCYINSLSVYADSYLMIIQLQLWTGSVSSQHTRQQLIYSMQHQVYIEELEGLLFFHDNQEFPVLSPG